MTDDSIMDEDSELFDGPPPKYIQVNGVCRASDGMFHGSWVVDDDCPDLGVRYLLASSVEADKAKREEWASSLEHFMEVCDFGSDEIDELLAYLRQP